MELIYLLFTGELAGEIWLKYLYVFFLCG